MTTAADTDAEAALWGRYRSHGCPEARDGLLHRYLPFLRAVAQSVAHKLPEHVTEDELLADGFLGLLDAVEAFDPGRGIKFTSFAALRVRGAMLDGLREVDWVPRLVRKNERATEARRTRLRQELGREPNDEDLGGVRRADRVFGSISLHTPLHEAEAGGVRTLADRLAAAAESPTAGAERRDFWRRACKGLSKRERLVLLLYFREDQRMKEIGRSLGLSESRVSQMTTALIPRVRENLRDED